MLTDIYIKNYLLVDQLHLELYSGLSILSGETGAGKSILVDSVSLALGARADNTIIRQGQQICEFTICFDVGAIPAAKTWLTEHDFFATPEQECIITRSINLDGRSRSSINGKPCPLQAIRELAPTLLVIHSQHQSQYILQQSQQQKYVDQRGKHDSMLQELQRIFSAWHTNQMQIKQFQTEAQHRNQQLHLFQYQHEELMHLHLQENEWQQLHEEHQAIHQTVSLLHHLTRALDLTAENERANALTLLHQAIAEVTTINPLTKQLSAATEMLQNAKIYLQEATDELQHYRTNLDLAPERLEYIEQRLTAIHDVARKHNVAPAELPQVLKSIQQKIQRLENIDTLLETIEREQQDLLHQYQQIANDLSKKRKVVAKTISKQITASMQQLGMQGGEFIISLEPKKEIISASGNEQVGFLIKTNPGQTLQPLAKVLSGGELSRIALALQALVVAEDNPPTFIFDEVDTGIGGKTAEIVGKLLHGLSAHSQVLCITHLAQVAVQGDHHYQVNKFSTEQSTTASIRSLSRQERVQELARMLSGSKITNQTLLHAEELLLHS